MLIEFEGGFDPVVVFDYLVHNGTQRADGRFLTFNDHLLDDTHRDTFDRWFDPVAWWSRVPLGRWDEILFLYGVMLYEFEEWAKATHGWNGYWPPSEV